ncbi:NAD(P)/FAD-dependent oxidoreductase [Nocardia sp. BMG111209]|uniref:FAD-dependent oxidoreductase n=1 Tax=Nocardia sp. BMG111209 TaxID=1160137 RepID=UPI0003732A50|nr:NAD(P)/FAD-dependent oxidoreductase [Nocardia sp. BMG111209]
MSIRSALVIGGGVAGPVTATALQMAGIEARVFEAYSGPAVNIGSSLGFAPNGLAALDVIGAGDAIRRLALPIRHSAMSFGHKTIEMPTAADLEPQQLVDRSDLHTALHDHAVAAGIPFEYDKRLVRVDERADHITAHFADGTSATADILIGCDGVKSTVRDLIDPNAPGANYTGMLGFGALSDHTLDTPAHTMIFAFGKNAYYLYWVGADGRVGWGANLPSKRYMSISEARAISNEQWLRTMRDTYGEDVPGADLVRHTRPENLVVSGALHIMPPVPHWHRGRMVLVGDSVHAPSNSTGQGASQAIESAIQLARCLRDFDDPATAFTAYERFRRPRVEAIAARGARINHAKTPGPVMRKVMPALMPLMFGSSKLQQIMRREQSYRIDWAAPVDEQAELAWA